MATASNSSSPVMGSSSKLQPNGQLCGTGLDKGLRADELQRHLSVWSVSTRSSGSNSSDDLNKFESDDEKRQSSTEDGALDSDDSSEDSSWETASEGESFEEISLDSDFVCPVSSLLREAAPTGVQHHGLRCHPRHSEDMPQMDRSDGFSSSSLAWRPSPSGRGDSTTSVARSIRAVLNKLTLEKFHQLYEQLFSSGIRRPEHVQILLKEVFDKAQVQHPFLPMYADLCARLAADARVTAACPSSEDCFARILLDMCQSCFAQLLAAEDDRPGSFDMEESRLRRKHRDLGTMKWIGELLTRGLLRSRLLCSCVQQLLAERRRCPQFVEFAAALLRSAGKTFDVPSWEHRPQLQKLFAEMEELSTSDSLSLRLRFLLRDLLELRAAAWESARPPKQLSKEARSPPSAPRLDAAKPLPVLSSVTTTQPCAKAVPFDLTAFRWLLTGTLRDLRADRDAKKAVARLKAAGVPRKLQAVEFSDMITRVAEDASGPARRASFAVLVRLSLGEESAFHHDECVRGTSIFFREVYPDLCDEVPRLAVVMSSEFLPLLRKSWTQAADLNGFLPKELR